MVLPEAAMRAVRGRRVAMIFQEPSTALNPVLKVGRQIAEVIERHTALAGEAVRSRTLALLDAVGIPDAARRIEEYPFQLSGGLKQRVLIACALAAEPEVLIADEPTTALDVTIQAQIVELVKRLRNELGMAIIWITHDLGIVAGIAHKVVVMYAGFIVERAAVKDLYASPQHPYTRGLIGSLPRVDAETDRRLVSIEGLPPDMLRPPTGCPFAVRCPYAFDQCNENPPLMSVGPGHDAACWWNIDEGKPRYDR